MKIFELNILWITLNPTYYWLMYAIWFLVWYYIIKKRSKILSKEIDNLFLYIFLWVILWWRLWYIIFYDIFNYINNPLSILKIWEWWMSFHGWVLWVIFAMYLFARKYKINFLYLADHIVLVLPIWLWLWRIWNYLNKELLWFSNYNWFLSVEKNWIMYFPSPLLEAFLEWLILFIILNYLYYLKINNKKSIKNWQIAALFLVFYWFFRIFVEIFFRQPDSHIWYIYWFLTMWEILSIPMIIIWLVYFIRLKKNYE